MDSSEQTLPAVRMWTADSMIEWAMRCDRCHRWRLRARYHELHSVSGPKGFTWWRECLLCTIQTLGDALVDARDLLRPLAKIANEEVCPFCRLGPALHVDENCPLALVGLDAALAELAQEAPDDPAPPVGRERHGFG